MAQAVVSREESVVKKTDQELGITVRVQKIIKNWNIVVR